MSGPILPLNGATVGLMALPTVVGTFFKHILPSPDSDPANRTELKSDEALAVARLMSQKITQYPVEDVQRLANTFQPAPWTVRVIRVSIPASTCSSAAEYLTAAFGPDEISNLIGGRQWWQLRENKDGSIEGEWIAMKHDLPRSPSSQSMSRSPSKRSPSPANTPHCRHPDTSSKASPNSNSAQLADLLAAPALQSTLTDKENLPHLFSMLYPGTTPSHPVDSNTPSSSTCEDEMASDPYEDDLDKMPCMLYVHGGAYYFGSINTHRYAIWRYAQEMGGRAFAVNYRLAPQYPFPCALADCLAAYLYLIRPPENAKHRMVDPSKIVIAGDSAGGGLSLALLTLIRDVGLPMPAGAVLISPWVDLTHSFPSIMSNSDTDILPPYGLMHQPSVHCPPSYVKSSVSGKTTATPANTSEAQPAPSTSQSQPPRPTEDFNPFKLKLCSELKVCTNKSDHATPIIELKDGQPVEMDPQIQLYATNDQLTHPYCSPLFSPSLGGLPPLLMIAGENEGLRDEIIYLAHRAAHPDRYHLREGLLNAHPERKAKIAEYPPTKVHLQVYDEMFHAKYCYRAIGSFCKFITASKTETNLNTSSMPVSTNLSLTTNLTSPPTPLPTPPPSALVTHFLSDRKFSRIAPDEPPQATLPEATLAELKHTIYHASFPERRPDFVDEMIRERVALDGHVRPLEDEAKLDILRISPNQLGIMKDGPLRRWAEGRNIPDKQHLLPTPLPKPHIYGLKNVPQSDLLDMPSNTIWSYILTEATYEPDAFRTPINVTEFIHFATPFLSKQYLLDLEERFHQLSQSEAGLDFTLRHHNVAILEQILADLQELNDGAGDNEKNQRQKNSSNQQKFVNHEDPIRSSPLDDSDGNDTLQPSGSDNPPPLDIFPQILHSFQEAILILVPMSAFKTPPKNICGRNRPISDRSKAFRTHPTIFDVSNDASLYNPHQQTAGIACIFHGTRNSSLASFYENGIQPAFGRNEFSFAPAFYASNDPQQAFEHPLHQHIGIISPGTIDTIAVIQFDVAVSVLHGIKSPGDGQPPFQVY
ncbi:hypothetical protein PtA15_5A608 [Puccinia triticina]|uniref:Alpha/beta hydrolase fold-3 domain-containing protein n=1 Tax=Puccinia triticina TaxID=208348 RepID=A0ABY7CIH1_9BASI|nr:uncharacterized protein PtA15_5A608 [Puccinia triticina]WAQ85034.1 hypothetical protein PtA15_5A608 [Puccinia triticina]WAR58371.1 hypothetical protein PtB15_5B605 [Puccinia triticina]